MGQSLSSKMVIDLCFSYPASVTHFRTHNLISRKNISNRSKDQKKLNVAPHLYNCPAYGRGRFITRPTLRDYLAQEYLCTPLYIYICIYIYHYLGFFSLKSNNPKISQPKKIKSHFFFLFCIDLRWI